MCVLCVFSCKVFELNALTNVLSYLHALYNLHNAQCYVVDRQACLIVSSTSLTELIQFNENMYLLNIYYPISTRLHVIQKNMFKKHIYNRLQQES